MKRRVIRRLLRELRDHVQNGMPHDLVFKPTAGLNKEETERLQNSLNNSFDRWRITWLFPWLDMLEQATEVDQLKS